MPSGGDVVTRALRRLRVLGANEEPSTEDMEAGLDLLNAFIDSLALEPFSMYQTLRTPKTLASGTASYTIGLGGDINIARPFKLERARLILSTSDSTPMEVGLPAGGGTGIFSDDEWARIVQKTLASQYIRGVWDNHAFDANQRTTLSVWPVPNVSTTQLILYSRVAVTELDQSTDVVFAPGYERMLEYNGACEFADHWDADITPRTQQIATSSLGRIKNANVRPTRVRMPPGMPGMGAGRRDIRQG